MTINYDDRSTASAVDGEFLSDHDGHEISFMIIKTDKFNHSLNFFVSTERQFNCFKINVLSNCFKIGIRITRHRGRRLIDMQKQSRKNKFSKLFSCYQLGNDKLVKRSRHVNVKRLIFLPSKREISNRIDCDDVKKICPSMFLRN